MQIKKFLIVGKLLVSAIAIVALVSMPARIFMPSASLVEVLLYCALGVVCFMMVLAVVTVCSLQISQVILRLGGTDTQWFWFSSEPNGLVALRRKMRKAKTLRDRDAQPRPRPR